MVSTNQNVSEKNFPELHSLPVLEQSIMNSEHSINIAGNLQSNAQ